MQNTGTLSELPLEGILETIQKDRATGTLQLSGSEGDATLFFLFGHLFHATDTDRQGEPVVYDALGWKDGDFTFDSKAKLPAEETIKASTADLLANRAAGSGAAPPPETTEEEAAAKAAASEVLAEAEESGIVPPTEESVPAAEVYSPPAGEVAQPDPSTDPGPAPKRRRTDKRPATRPPETMELYPVPLGELIYESLTAAFVDFPKLLRSLSKDQHSGYVRLSGNDFRAVLLFSSGAVVEAIYDGHGDVLTGNDAFQRFGKDIDNSEGNLDVIELTPEMVTGIFQLLTGPSLYDKLTARFVKVDALLEYLSEEGTSGAVIVRLDNQTGIVLYREGTILGCYTDTDPGIETDPAKILAICKNDKAAIEVRGGPVPDALPVLEAGGSGLTSVPTRSSAPIELPAATPEPAPEPEPEPAPEPEAAAAEPEHQPEPEPATEAEPAQPATPAYAAASVNGADGGEVDWATLISAMAGRADAVLGTRSKKVKELLYSAGHTREDVEGTIERISELSIMFVDPSKLTALAADMRQIAAGTG